MVGIAEAQQATVRLDARPGRELPGRVTQVALQSVAYWGNVTHRVVGALDGNTDGLMWG